MNSDKIVDTKGLSCPMPIVRTKKAMDELTAGQILEIHATDKGAIADIPAWAKSSGNELVNSQEDGDVLKFWIKKG